MSSSLSTDFVRQLLEKIIARIELSKSQLLQLPWGTYLAPRNVAVASIAYLLLVRLLRYRRRDKIHAKFPFPTRDSLSRMTTLQAWEINKMLGEYEFPFMGQKALQFALFRTYGIPTISKLLVDTKQLSDVSLASKQRYADTEVLIGEFVINPPDSERTINAISRMNYLHSGYRKSGKISNDDLLYTLSLFALEPIKFVGMYEWRGNSELEKCAVGVFWKAIGDAQGISFEALRRFHMGWKDGLEWLEDVQEWATKYEQQHMVPSEYNKKTADETVRILVYDVPGPLKWIGNQFVSCLMDEKLRTAMMYPPPYAPLKFTVDTGLLVRKYFLRYLALPRIIPFKAFSQPDPKTGRSHKVLYMSEPWYIPATFANRWGITAWYKWTMGLPYPGDPKYEPDGYDLEEVGPKLFRGKGKKEMEETRRTLTEARRGGCPFAV
ncbi:hypothetical protein P152DRAFT_465172 [Eremomyces bilateralis CBS 781.70]|uniref:ER-bound oxygenase mpaB/mpaB'/Rubber oxygenase catalytic domain-containing protein n=1 Tax=Eremomyces bilateralis CBS 781.70 TaxID=1392243 RepID=A0A6G1G8T2_9PEZI|nr:uncharacterized protein P152DRAFT_465172 [Eremomyces bilateralis CBS 781.70]KAF1814269.1 hypothetical protein P152DRAFT_465172 [Eremomyces bilateralis CBS 781.70]